MRNTIVVSSAGGPASENVILNLNIARGMNTQPHSNGKRCRDPYIVGLDMDDKLIQLSSADEIRVVPRATNLDGTLNTEYRDIVNSYQPQLFIPQSDAEVYIASKYRNELPKMILPKYQVIELCQDKRKLYEYLQSKGVALPPFKHPTKDNMRELMYESPNYGFWNGWYPCWVRASKGAGGHAAFVAKNWRDFRNMAEFYSDENIEWQLVKLLRGKNYSWTSLWKDGELVTSVLKERVKWVYNRIGTTALQFVVHDDNVNQYCESIIKTLTADFDRNLSGIMFCDLMQDTDDNKFYLTEINAGRSGTVSFWHGYASQHIYKDARVNWHYLLWEIANDIDINTKYNFKKYNALPKNLGWARNMDFQPKMLWSK